MISLLMSSSRMFSLRESASSCEGSGASALGRERKFFSTSSRWMSLPSTTAQTSGPGAMSFLQEAAKEQRVTAVRMRMRRFKRRTSRWGNASGDLLRESCAGGGGFGDAARTDARSADADLLARAVDNSLHVAQIGIPAAAADVVRVADHVAIAGLLAADFTCECHCLGAPEGNFRFTRSSMLAEI